jgi:hypothetical protein
MASGSPRVEILTDFTEVETIAVGGAIRERRRLVKAYGPARWRKRKGHALICLADGVTQLAEIHWYEAAGVGRKEFKLKRFLDRGS